ncbi:MAG TPA: hypothetical protein VMD56_14360 [Steroidobacteraceae bacterium]|nr:hypothetical protein [Steroidobacteraceae bacterium]
MRSKLNNRTRWMGVGIGVLGALLVLGGRMALAQRPGGATEPRAGVTRLPVSINALMVALTDRSAEPFWDASQKPPQTQEQWDFLRYYATDIALAGVLISYPGTGQYDAGWVRSPDWQRRARALTAAGMQALAAVDARNDAQIRAAGDELVRVCNDCHMLYKPDIPSQGIIMHSEYYNPKLYGKPK